MSFLARSRLIERLAQPRTLPGRLRLASPTTVTAESMGRVASNPIFVHLSFDRAIRRDWLESSLVAVSRAVPEVAARFCTNGIWSYWKCDEFGSETGPAVQEHEAGSSMEAEGIIKAFYASPPPLYDALVMKIAIIHTGSGDHLLAWTNHVLVDGQGVLELMSMIAESYGAVARGESPLVFRDFENSALLKLLPGASMKAVREFARQMLAAPQKDDESYVRVPMERSRTGTQRLETVRVDADLHRALKARWKHRGVTTNDILMAAFSRAIRRLFGDDVRQKVRLLVTFDMRASLNVERYIGNMALARAIDVREVAAPPERTLLAISEEMRRLKQDGAARQMYIDRNLLNLILPRGLLFALRKKVLRSGPFLLLTNPGRLAGHDFGDAKCTYATMVGLNSTWPIFSATATGFGELVDLHLTYKCPGIDASLVRSIAASIRAELGSLA